MKEHHPIPPKAVGKGAVFENIDRDDQVDLFKFPVPFLHELDGGRFVGTDDIVIMRDPEDNWVNCATYRVMVQDKDRVSIWISPGKHGRQIREKYFKAGKPCPVLISCGHDPLLFLAGGNELKLGLSEYDYAGGHRGVPYEVVPSELHGLPMPAHAELVLEGEMVEGVTAKEGPFGEFTGYYGRPSGATPYMRVERVRYRDNPTLTCALMADGAANEAGLFWAALRSAGIWADLQKLGVPGIQGVW
jgi:4-hydroxy-3-polyprenylbenzoate decarboxylase